MHISENNEINFLDGVYTDKDFLSPSYINISNPKYIEVDGVYHSTLVITNYCRENYDLILKNIIDTNIDVNISIFYEKQDAYKTIKDLTYHIGNVGSDLKTYGENRQDIDIAAFTYNDAKYIRKEIQVNNEDLYFLYIYINIFSRDLKELSYVINKIEGILQGKNMQTKKAYFRQDLGFVSSLPFMENSKLLKEIGRRNALTSGVVGTYPFISSSIFDEDGILIGTNIYNNSLIFLDRYSTKYKNANMCIFGTSGAGKSFYTKLTILRYRLLGIEQYIIDPEREYLKMCKKLDGTILKIGPNSGTYINVFDIREDSLEDGEKGYLSTKITKLVGFFDLIFGGMDEEYKALVEEKIIETYKNKGITFDDESLYNFDENLNKKVFKSFTEMPKLEDFYKLINRNKELKVLRVKLLPFIKGSLKFFNNYTNVELNNKLILADIYELGEENLKYGMYVFTELFWDRIKKDRNVKKAIYLDEIWRLIGVTSNKNVASFIYKIFKTIRKYGGSAIAITQDISDLFSLENGAYGKSILNNSSIKNFFSMEEENLMILEKYLNITEKEKIEIKSLKRGECLMFAGDDHILTKIESSNTEKEIISGVV